ncbi:alpha/beta fold hydrolase [Mycolicibacterium murale]|uniref:alpha/beta fold hydrolase n=1 Tax=Mycolicibacterium murale TaxID=182220 RepID=UPI001874D702|nr:alpha/beta fold hydrolase [Mycolicibacterium murale]
MTRVLELGDGAQRVLLLHGAGSRADRWTAAMPHLCDGRTVQAIDFPGHGFADKPTDFSYTSPAFTEAVIGYLNSWGPAALVGTSLGAHVATLVAERRPDLVTSLVLVGATGIVPRNTASSSAIADRSPAGVRAKMTQLFFDPTLVDDASVREEHLVNTSPGAEQALEQVLRYLQNGITADLVEGRLSSIDTPVLLMWGSDDRWIPLEVGERIAAIVPQSPFVILDRCRHAPYAERPAEFGDVVSRFITDPASIRPGRQLI